MSLKEIRNCGHVILRCDSMKETCSIYEDVMGFQLEFDSDD